MTFKVGDYVVISERGKATYKASANNPHNATGIVTQVRDPLLSHPITVEWDTSRRRVNVYYPEELDLIVLTTSLEELL